MSLLVTNLAQDGNQRIEEMKEARLRWKEKQCPPRAAQDRSTHLLGAAPNHLYKILLWKPGGFVFLCFAFCSLTHVDLSFHPSLWFPVGSKYYQKGRTHPTGSCHLDHNDSHWESQVPAGRAKLPREGNDQGQCWGRSICSKALAPFSSCGHCYFPLTSCLRAPGKDRKGNTATIQWRLMTAMSHTSEQWRPVRGMVLKGQGAPLMLL